uniref:Uncharacterized protein n=1 Tax=Musa acuminata subsp. malaccensis TaxID=214687 RepID=A0A804K0X2_MUSAM
MFQTRASAKPEISIEGKVN